jgi:hypothetical protein
MAEIGVHIRRNPHRLPFDSVTPASSLVSLGAGTLRGTIL